jgi:hypothetical protein
MMGSKALKIQPFGNENRREQRLLLISSKPYLDLNPAPYHYILFRSEP